MAHELLSELHRRGIRLRLTDDGLDVLAPSGTLTGELRDRLRLQRDELISLLRSHQVPTAPEQITPRSADRHEPFPLTDIQHAYWVGRSASVELGGVATHLYFELDSGLRTERLESSLQRVIARHDMLRACVQLDGRQRVAPEVPRYEIAVTDLRGRDAAAREAELLRLRSELDHQVLATDRWPLFDIRAAELDDGRLRLFFSFDIMILDGLSLYVLFQDWRRFYEDPQWAPEPLALSYRDHVLHEEETRRSSQYPVDEAYWLDRLDALPLAPTLPLKAQPSQLERTEFSRRSGHVPRERWALLKDRAQRRGVTPSTLLLTAFSEVLRRWSEQPDFTLNLTLFNRPQVHPEINQVIGDFTALTVLAVEARPELTFSERAQRLQQQLMRDLEHQTYSGVRLLRERTRRLGSGPNAGMPVVFTSALVLGAQDEDPTEGIQFFGEQVYGLTQTPQVWLDHQVSEQKGALTFNWDTVDALFPAGMLDDLFAAYCEVLDRLVENEEVWDRTLSPAQLPRTQALERAEVNATERDFPGGTLCGLVEAQAERTPGATAVVFGDQEFTYGETVAAAHRLAGRLAGLGVAPNTLVGVVLERGWEQVAAVLGVTRCGGAYLPVDPQWPAARRAQLLRQGAARVVVTSPELRDSLEWPADTTLVTFADVEVQGGAGEAPGAGPSPQDLAYVIYTSGSTGRPKGVMIDHRSAVNTLQDINSRFGVGPDDRVLALSALSFDLSVYDVFGTLAAGGAVVLPSPGSAQDPAHWSELVRRHGVTVWNSVPALMQAWVDSHGRVDDAPPSRLRLVMLSGDWIPVALPGALGALHPRAEVISLGGATEASIWSVCFPIGEVPAEWSRVPYGKPLANQTLHVYDEQMQPCPMWATGEIHIGGAGVAIGYWQDPGLTAERFVVHPVTGERLYRTGDLGRYLPSGDIEFLGRADFQVKLNGYRVELGEIAAALRRQPGVGEAVVDVRTSPATGRRHLVTYVVPAGGRDVPVSDAALLRRSAAAGQEELRGVAAQLAPQLAAYGELWKEVERVCPAVMARTLSGLGLFRADGDTATVDRALRGTGVKRVYHRLIEQWLGVLASAGLLHTTGRPGEYRCEQAFDAEALDRTVRTSLAALSAGEGQQPLIDYFVSCVDSQLGLLRGEVSPLGLLMPDGDTRVTEALYASNPVSHLQNRVAAKVMSSAVEGRGEDTVRIMEVGAGTGATTAQVLAELAPERVHYSFTDISSYFGQQARKNFSSYEFLEYGTYDIDRPPNGQGVLAGSVDIVLAANVMHDARDVCRSLGHIRSMLGPSGILVMIEGTENSLQQMLTVGFLEGLAQDHKEDEHRLPLLSVPQWQEQLKAAGFTRVTTVPDGEQVVDAHLQHVLIAEAAGGVPAVDHESLREALEEVLPEYMVPRHYVITDTLPLTANGKVDMAALPLPPSWLDGGRGSSTAPRGELETRLFAMWSEALERDDFGVEDNFFELGGDSLHAVAIINRLRDELDFDAPAEEGLELLFDHPTVAELAAALPSLKE